MSEFRSGKAEVGGRKWEVGSRKSEVGGWKSEVGRCPDSGMAFRFLNLDFRF
jgi:hypothetical protein